MTEVHQNLLASLQEAGSRVNQDFGRQIVGGVVILLVDEGNGNVRPQARITGPKTLAMWALTAILEGMLKMSLRGSTIKRTLPAPPTAPPVTEEGGDGEVN